MENLQPPLWATCSILWPPSQKTLFQVISFINCLTSHFFFLIFPHKKKTLSQTDCNRSQAAFGTEKLPCLGSKLCTSHGTFRLNFQTSPEESKLQTQEAKSNPSNLQVKSQAAPVSQKSHCKFQALTSQKYATLCQLKFILK